MEAAEEPIAIDLAELRGLTADEPAYGAALTRMLLREGDVRPFYEQALAVVESKAENERPTLHLRLHIDAPRRFHALRWESLRDPRSGVPIATQTGVLLSRYLSSPDWRLIPPGSGSTTCAALGRRRRPDRTSANYRPGNRVLARSAGWTKSSIGHKRSALGFKRNVKVLGARRERDAGGETARGARSGRRRACTSLCHGGVERRRAASSLLEGKDQEGRPSRRAQAR